MNIGVQKVNAEYRHFFDKETAAMNHNQILNDDRALSKTDKMNLKLNLAISAAVFVLGISSIAVSAASKADENFFFEFRYMTMNGTVFTTLISVIIIILCAVQLKTGRIIQSDRLYYFRLSSAVTECIISVVILLSLLPFVPDNPDILTFDSFTMHIVIPLLSVISFLLNKTPVEFSHPLLRLNCAWLITLYAAVVITLILLGWIPQDKIPYSFFDFYSHPFATFIYFGVFIYSFTYILSYLFSAGNERLSFLWKTEPKKPVRPQ